MSTIPSVFSFTDYRQYLAAYYTAKKQETPSFSYRQFAGKAEISSSGLYKEVVDGKRNLSKTLMGKFAKALNLSENESDYFFNMVLFCDSDSQEQRSDSFERMLRHKQSNAAKVHASQYEYFSHWYYSAVRELLDIADSHEKYNALAEQFAPSISPHQVKEAIDILRELGMISWNEGTKRYEKANQTVTTGYSSEEKINRMNLVNYQKDMVKKGMEAYDRFLDKDLDMSTLTLSVSNETYQKIKQEMREFRKKLLSMAERDSSPERICQINSQLFPLTRSKGKQK